ncbi:MAG TPA: prepilin-type N-terminal cleavage/methylation domain-containing protein [Gemmatimonadaceae bacterium]|nr:prepilin-type N-terminal cleavage/methylation domain-containing protein [Gemmatimonadaceae bacterium]
MTKMFMGRPSASALRRCHGQTNTRAGFSLLEILIVLIVIAVLAGIAIPKIGRLIRHERVNRAAQVLVQDLQNGFAMAGRQRAPVRLTFTPSTKTYAFSDRATGTLLQTRVMSIGSEYSLTSLSSSSATIDILPNGIGSTAFNVTLANGDYQRIVYASTAGFIRMSPQ